MKTKKYNTPSCIKNYMNEININCIHVSIFTVPEKPNCYSHHQIKCGPDWGKNPTRWIK